MQVHFNTLDWLVLVAYFIAMLAVGVYFWSRHQSVDEFTAGGRTLPGWLCGLSIFATFLSSISYLALPGKSYSDNWSPFVFSLSLPLATLIAVRYFVPLYRRSGEVSAYAFLEKRFGPWARLYASCFYLLFQIARSGFVMFLMALPMTVIFGWDIRTVILVTGVVVTVYSLIGGIVAVIWADAIQAVVLFVGAVVALGWIFNLIPEGLGRVIELGGEEGKFSLGSMELLALAEPTLWAVFMFGLFENLKNFGVDQSHVQRYVAAKSDAAARRSLLLSAGLYIPISALFFLIGTSLFVFHVENEDAKHEVRRLVAQQQLMQQGVPPGFRESGEGQHRELSRAYAQRLERESLEITDQQLGDRVFPHFIAAYLPNGVTGLLVAAIFSAAMSTVSTSLNSSATLVMSDIYRRFIHPRAGEEKLLIVLRLATFVWGGLGTIVALSLVELSGSALDSWWQISSALGAGILGIFLLGFLRPMAGNGPAILAVVVGSIVIAWMTFSTDSRWPEDWQSIASPFHKNWIIVIGAIVIVGVGFLLPSAKAGNSVKQP